jgi:hypothetical protein
MLGVFHWAAPRISVRANVACNAKEAAMARTSCILAWAKASASGSSAECEYALQISFLTHEETVLRQTEEAFDLFDMKNRDLSGAFFEAHSW